MLEPRAADHAVWLVALLLYVYDAARLLGPRQMLLVEAAGGRLAPALGDNPFASGARALAFGPLHLPHRGVFVAAWGRPWSDDATLAATLEALGQLRGSLGPLRWLAALAGGLLFVVGPALTVTLGPDAAVLYTAAVLYPTVGAAIAALWWRRRRLRLTAGRSVVLSLEVLVCPAFLPNLVRKIIGQHPVETDAAQVLAATAPAEVREELLARLARRAEAILDDDADPAARPSLQSYLATLRTAR
ncbi:MAG TPA: hypothetical protein VF136_15415 [Methylomirabilota bacterium]